MILLDTHVLVRYLAGDRTLGRRGIQEHAVDGELAIAAAELPDTHGDPADRMLVATAVERGFTLLTADETLLAWKLRGFKTLDATA